MTIKDRVGRREGRDHSARWDPGETNRWRSYPSAPYAPSDTNPLTHVWPGLEGRPGAAERMLAITTTEPGVTPARIGISLHGWLHDALELNERQARHLHAILGQFLAQHDAATASD